MSQPHALSDEEFASVVRLAPLVSIDLIIRSPVREVLVGLRTNEPAKGFYFVPGGRIHKGETIGDAFVRILAAETGFQAGLGDARLLGAYQHIYDTNALGRAGFGTHYVVLGYEVLLQQRLPVRRDRQHSEFRWMSETELMSSPAVHQNTKAYFAPA